MDRDHVMTILDRISTELSAVRAEVESAPRAGVSVDDIPIDDLELGPRTTRILRRLGITTIGSLLLLDDRDLLSFRGLGRGRLRDIRE